MIAHMLPSIIWLFSPCRQRETATRLQLLPPWFCVSVVLISPVSSECPATMLTLLSSQAEPGYWLLAALLAMAGLSESVLMSKFRTSALVSEGKSKQGWVAPDPEKKWMVILWYDTSNTVQLDPEDRKYDQYQHACNWMEKICIKLLPEQTPERDELHLWKLFRSARSASNGFSIRSRTQMSNASSIRL
jgi:hypothetical protein